MVFTAPWRICFFVAAFLIVSVRSQDMFSDTTGFEGDNITLTCNLSQSVYDTTSLNFYGVRSLTVSKLNTDTYNFETLAIYGYPDASGSCLLKNEMDSAYYDVQAQGLNPDNPNDYQGNQNQMQLTISFKSLRCDDRGKYQCSALYAIRQTPNHLQGFTSTQRQDLRVDGCDNQRNDSATNPSDPLPGYDTYCADKNLSSEIHPDPYSCYHFVTCTFGRTYHMPCPAGLAFSVKYNVCIEADKVDCSQNVNR